MGFPSPSNAQIWIDFDGTITQRDTLDDLISGHAINDSWRHSEDLWQAGKIGSHECLQQQFSVVRISDADLETFLDNIQLDAGFVPLINLLNQLAVPHAIVSDGIDSFIRHVLRRHNLNIPIRSNTIERHGEAMTLLCPLTREDCRSAAAHCKCASITNLGSPRRQSIYIGDGRSDLCPARTADYVFAKGALAAALESEQRAFTRFQTLNDLLKIMQQNWQI